MNGTSVVCTCTYVHVTGTANKCPSLFNMDVSTTGTGLWNALCYYPRDEGVLQNWCLMYSMGIYIYTYVSYVPPDSYTYGHVNTAFLRDDCYDTHIPGLSWREALTVFMWWAATSPLISCGMSSLQVSLQLLLHVRNTVHLVNFTL